MDINNSIRQFVLNKSKDNKLKKSDYPNSLIKLTFVRYVRQVKNVKNA